MEFSPPTSSWCSWPRVKPDSATILSPREIAPPAFHVATDPWLFRHIASFQGGIPVALYQFWIDHDPKPARGAVTYELIAQVLKLVVESGSLYYLELIRSSRFYKDGQWRMAKFGWLARVAIANHRVDICQWMVATGMPLTKPRALWREAVQNHVPDDDFTVLDLLHQAYPLTETDANRLIPRAVSKPTVPLLQWITAHFPSVAFPMALTKAAAADGDLAVLTFLLGHPHSRGCHITAFRVAYHSRHLDVLDFLVASSAGTMNEDFAGKLVLDNTPPIQDIVHRYPAFFTSACRKAFLDAMRAGDCDKMKDLFATGMIETADLFSIDDAASWKGLAGLEFLHERGMARATTEAMDTAAEAKRWDVVEFLHLNRPEGCTMRAADAAVDAREIKCVRFFLENRNEGCSVDAMDRVAANGSMEILRFLHHHSKPGCTTKAMDAAATRGHFRVVQFLHSHRPEGCTTTALDGAARGGFLDVVQYLCEHRTEGCTMTAVQAALENHHLEVVQVLYEHYPRLFGVDLLSDLLLRGAFEIFMKLREAYPEQAGSVVEPVMFEAGKQLELRTIRFILTEMGRSDLRPFALEGAACLGGEDGRQWRKAVEAITTPTELHLTTMDSGFSLRHPFLRDERTPTWAVQAIFSDSQVDVDVYRRCAVPFKWPIRAVYHHDLTLLQIIRDLPSGATEPCLMNPARRHFGYEPLSFAGARAAAIRLGDKPILEWLLTSVDFPTETTLLDEAVYYHQFEIAEWLLVNHPAACTELDWTNKGNETGVHEFGFRDGLLDWLEAHDGVRNALSFTGMIDFAARKNDVESLERLHGWYPELFTPRPSLVALADLEECRDTINFLLEIGWSPDVFFEGC